ncbi:shikimate dehydrogenase [Nitrincola alkalisediminis]|uniref:shikimate dehydrogenase n=1 Tax=Nitrincola alkalisediminis TaxID=1366656 RepID=UPI0018774BF2|nr:shikimate dehydrogenase [Nitrincola alkalisediminis]
MIDQYAVFGNPISHSKSPTIHRLFAEQLQQRLEYSAHLSDVDRFEQDIQHFFAEGGKGTNVTLPFKEMAWKMAERLSEAAQLAGAANTLWMQDNLLHADNTDGVGLVNDLLNNCGATLKGRHLVVLGAGGAVRGVIKPLLDSGCASIVIANRTFAKAKQLADIFSELAQSGVSVDACEFAALSPSPRVDIVINGTSASIQGDVPPVPDGVVSAHTLCYDMMYSNTQTAFCRWARSQGAERVFDGLGMLVEQAAESFSIWRGVKPDTAPVIELLRQSLSHQ